MSFISPLLLLPQLRFSNGIYPSFLTTPWSICRCSRKNRVYPVCPTNQYHLRPQNSIDSPITTENEISTPEVRLNVVGLNYHMRMMYEGNRRNVVAYVMWKCVLVNTSIFGGSFSEKTSQSPKSTFLEVVLTEFWPHPS